MSSTVGPNETVLLLFTVLPLLSVSAELVPRCWRCAAREWRWRPPASVVHGLSFVRESVDVMVGAVGMRRADETQSAFKRDLAELLVGRRDAAALEAQLSAALRGSDANGDALLSALGTLREAAARADPAGRADPRWCALERIVVESAAELERLAEARGAARASEQLRKLQQQQIVQAQLLDAADSERARLLQELEAVRSRLPAASRGGAPRAASEYAA